MSNQKKKEKKISKHNEMLVNSALQEELDNLSEIVCEKEDIVGSMKDEAGFSRNWINDALLRRYIKKTGDNHLNAKTRKLIKIKSYLIYFNYSREVREELSKQIAPLISEIQE